MTDRRRYARYGIAAPALARARTVIDGILESWQHGSAVVLSTRAAAPGDEFVMQFTTPSGELTTCAVRVIESARVVEAAVIRFRLHLCVSPLSDGGGEAFPA